MPVLNRVVSFLTKINTYKSHGSKQYNQNITLEKSKINDRSSFLGRVNSLSVTNTSSETSTRKGSPTNWTFRRAVPGERFKTVKFVPMFKPQYYSAKCLETHL